MTSQHTNPSGATIITPTRLIIKNNFIQKSFVTFFCRHYDIVMISIFLMVIF